MSSFQQIDPATVYPRRLTEFIEMVNLGDARGRYIQLRVTNKQGYAELKSVRVQAQQAGKGMDRKEPSSSK